MSIKYGFGMTVPMDFERAIGLRLPCNVVVCQEENASVHIESKDPAALLNLVDNPTVYPIAGEVKFRPECARAAL